MLKKSKGGDEMGNSVKDINKQIERFTEAGAKPKLLIIGYRTYAALMREDKFTDKITKDNKDPMIRYYKGIKIQMVTEKHHFDIQ